MIAIIDYDAGNTRSVMNMLNRLGAEFDLTDNADRIKVADKVIFPGVGHAAASMSRLKEKGLIDVIRQCQQPFLGICVGMQLMYEASDEGNTTCLGLLPGRVKAFTPSPSYKVPHMGWNDNKLIQPGDKLFINIDHIETYFVHSYYAEVDENTLTTCNYESTFSSAVKNDNFYGVQFHPEKSGKVGEMIMKNFLNL